MIAAEVRNMKASWLCEIPSHWDIVRLKTLLKGGTNGAWGSEPKNNKNDIVCVRVADIDEWQYGISESDLTYRNISETDQNGRLLNYGDLIIEKSGGGEISPVGRVVIYNLDKKAVTSNFMARLNVVGDVNKEFLYYYFRFLYQRRLNHPAIKATTGIQNLDLYAYLQNPIPIPTSKEQESIVEFINNTSGEITHFIQTKQRFIELLKEQRQSIITNAVTKGIDENVKMKATVLGEIPEHWEVRRLKTLVDMKSGENITAESIYQTGEYPVYGGNGLRGFTKTYANEGDFVLIGRQGALCGNINYASGKFFASEHAVVVYPKVELDFFWLGETLRMMNLNQYSMAAAQPGLAINNIRVLLVPFPPKNEQKQIVEHIKFETKTLDIAISKAEREIDLIKEYREAMIAEAVTGKMKL